ncbi:MAG: ATP-grasp domain-containing protein [Rubrivivax sp.]|nr:ATP-grasp domain-containing protein [Rubrivivax sp.]
MTPRVLVANRGEIAIRVLRAAAGLGWHGVAASPSDDRRSLHVRKADEAVSLPGSGVRAYLDVDAVVRAARDAGCGYVHPGYGFLSERADFARACAGAGLAFVGPDAATLELLGDKARARALAARCDVPVLRGTPALAGEDEAQAFLASLGGAPMVLKAVGGGGGRGIRVVQRPDEVAEALARCRSEALSAFGNAGVYAEEFLAEARHVEVQVVGDGSGTVVALGERECTLQRRHQKLVEVAPSPSLADETRERLLAAATRLARELRYRSLGTFEFLVAPGPAGPRLVFIEANPRLQVEHTVTEEVHGVDLVQLQLRLAAGEALGDVLGDVPPRARGSAMQLRVTMEQSRPDGTQVPGVGTLTAYELPSGPGVRVDGCGYVGYANDPGYDPLLAKVIVHVPDGRWDTLLRKAYRALCETRIDGIPTNLAVLRNLLLHPAVQRNELHTRFFEEQQQALLAPAAEHPALTPEAALPAAGAAATPAAGAPDGAVAVPAPAAGRIVELGVAVGDVVRAGEQLGVLESMKTEFRIDAERAGTVVAIAAAPGTAVAQDAPILWLTPDGDDDGSAARAELQVDLDRIRPDLQAVFDAHARRRDAARPEAVQRRRKHGMRTARENVADLCDDGTFTEYGGLILAAQRMRRTLEELEQISPADGLVAGIGSVNGDLFDATRTRCVVMAYDYTVLAGSQGYMAHEKKRRMLRLALKWRLPVVLFAEGGGGRPGDTDHLGGLRLFNPTFWGYARLHGRVPSVGIAAGRCFAGNAALLGVCDLIVATEDASIGMGGPAMIEGGGLGVVAAEDVGPVAMQSRNGVIDVVVRDEAAAVAVAKRYLSYFQGRLRDWRCADQRLLRHVVPEDPRRAYDMRRVIELLADEGSLLELQRGHGTGVITALVRIEGHAFAILANNPVHLSGAIDAAASEKAARFIAQAQSGGLPVVALCDTPGFMVGPDAEAEGLVRRAGQMFIAGANVTVPYFTVVVRKAYGLGAVAMVGGNAHEQVFAVSWPTGHFGKMGLEGYVKLAYRKELEQIDDPQARRRRVDEMVAAMHAKGTALKTAPFLSIDDVIDPMDTRRWLVDGLVTARQQRGGPDEQTMY